MICKFCNVEIIGDGPEGYCYCDVVFDYDDVGQYDTLEEKELDEEIDAINADL